MRKVTIRAILLATVLVSLTACGGGGGGGRSGLESVPPPPPPPPPSPPTPPTLVSIFPSITTSTEFATLGYEISADPAQPPIKQGFSVRYDAISNAYIIDLPAHPAGEFRATSSNDAYWSGGLPAGSILWPPISVLKPTATNPLIQLNYTSFASYSQAGPMDDLPHGVVAFGTPTAASAVPTVGSATMNAIVSGITSDRLGTIGGTATFNFDFGAGTLSGRVEPVLGEFYTSTVRPLGTYTFTNTVFGIGSPVFYGTMTHADPRLTGAFNGLFTGPAAQELMAQWTGTYFVEGVTPSPERMFGVMVGRRCC